MDYVGHRVAQEAAKAGSSTDTPFTPINVILFSVLLYTAYSTMSRSNKAAPISRGPPPKVFRTYTPRTLLPFNGQEGGPIFFAVRGRVFDVSNGRSFYGPGGPYENFAGRDATRGLACHSFDEEMLTKDLDGPLDNLEGLGPSEMEALQGWEETFTGKYDIVGKLVSADEFNAAKPSEAAQ